MTHRSSSAPPRPRAVPEIGVEIAGTGHAVPDRVITNHDLEQVLDTSDEWIVQRTGIRERRHCDPAKGETTRTLSTLALRRAMEDAGVDGADLDLVIVGSVTGEMTCPATACRVAADVGAAGAGAFDVLAACCGFVYSMNIAHDMIRAGSMRTVGVVGCDVMSRIVDERNRAVAVLFGDAAGAAILRATPDASRGLLCGMLHADGTRWADLYIPNVPEDHPENANYDPAISRPGTLLMNGRSVYKFAVGQFPDLISKTLEAANLAPDEIDHYVCHQSNARMLESARERFGIPPEKMPVNIDRYGNCSGGSVPVVLDELRQTGACRAPGELAMLVAFGGGLTWASSLWRL